MISRFRHINCADFLYQSTRCLSLDFGVAYLLLDFPLNVYQKCINARFSKLMARSCTISVLPSFRAKRNRNPFKIRDCGIYLILIIDYSIIVATFPEPTVLPPSRQRTCVLYHNLGAFSYIFEGIFVILLPIIFIYSDS